MSVAEVCALIWLLWTIQEDEAEFDRRAGAHRDYLAEQFKTKKRVVVGLKSNVASIPCRRIQSLVCLDKLVRSESVVDRDRSSSGKCCELWVGREIPKWRPISGTLGESLPLLRFATFSRNMFS